MTQLEALCKLSEVATHRAGLHLRMAEAAKAHGWHDIETRERKLAEKEAREANRRLDEINRREAEAR